MSPVLCGTETMLGSCFCRVLCLRQCDSPGGGIVCNVNGIVSCSTAEFINQRCLLGALPGLGLVRMMCVLFVVLLVNVAVVGVEIFLEAPC